MFFWAAGINSQKQRGFLWLGFETAEALYPDAVHMLGVFLGAGCPYSTASP